jgi:TRAP-type C4-dicarboxylate transport system permease small subunit
MITRIQNPYLYMEKALSVIMKICLYIGLICLSISAIVIIIDIVVRQFGLAGVSSTEITGYMLVALAFLPAAYTFKQGLFIRITVITERLSPTSQKVLGLVTDFIILLVAIILAKSCWGLTLTLFHDQTTAATVLAPRLYIPQAATSVGLSLLIISIVSKMLQSIFIRSGGK